MKTELQTKFTMRVLALVLVICLLPLQVFAAKNKIIEPRASDYLMCYRAYMYDTQKGTIQVWFDVTGTERMEELGVLSIEIYESTNNRDWTGQARYHYTSYRNMLGHNENIHSGHITYSMITSGHYYKARVCVWGGRNGQGDSRYIWTNTIRIP